MKADRGNPIDTDETFLDRICDRDAYPVNPHPASRVTVRPALSVYPDAGHKDSVIICIHPPLIRVKQYLLLLALVSKLRGYEMDTILLDTQLLLAENHLWGNRNDR
jgi:hypothetical protein